MSIEAMDVQEASPKYGFTAAKPTVPAGYKRTEVGVIPEDWGVLPLGSLAAIVRGKFSARPRNDPRFYRGGYPFLQTGDVTRAGAKITSFTQTLNEEGIKVSRLFPKGTLFFTIAANIGDVGISEFEAACPDSLVAISPNSIVDKVWLLYELASRKEGFEALASPGAQLNINLEKLRPYLLPVPPPYEQRAIASALSDVDALLEELDRLIAKKRDIKQATMQQLLTGQTRLPGFEGEWETKRIGELLTICHGRNQHEVEVNDGQFPILATSGIIGTSKHALYNRPSVLIGRKGTINKPRYMDTPFWSVDTLFYSVIEEDNDAKYLYYQFLMIDWLQYNEASGVPSLSARTIENIEITCPQPLEQRAISSVLSDLDAEIKSIEQRRAKTAAIKQAMMQELLTGRTRLVNSAD